MFGLQFEVTYAADIDPQDYRWFQDLEEQCRLLEADNSRD